MAQLFPAELSGEPSRRLVLRLSALLSAKTLRVQASGAEPSELDASRRGICCVLGADVCGGRCSPVSRSPDFAVVNKR